MIRSLIVDDDPMARQVIRHLIEEVEFLTVAGVCENAMEAIGLLSKEKIDLIFLDVVMPEINGLELLKSLTRKPLVILITARSDYAMEAFDQEVVDYLVKPIRPARFLKAINRAKDLFDLRRKQEPGSIFVRSDNALQRIDLDEILHIDAMDNYVRISTPKKDHVVHSKLKNLLKKLPEGHFIQIHRSHIVPLRKIDSFADNMVTIRKTVLPVSNHYRAALLEKLSLL